MQQCLLKVLLCNIRLQGFQTGTISNKKKHSNSVLQELSKRTKLEGHRQEVANKTLTIIHGSRKSIWEDSKHQERDKLGLDQVNSLHTAKVEESYRELVVLYKTVKMKM